MLNLITIYSFVYNCCIQKLKGFFNDPTSFNIAIDMLFTKGQYEGEFHLSIVILHSCFSAGLNVFVLHFA